MEAAALERLALEQVALEQVALEQVALEAVGSDRWQRWQRADWMSDPSRGVRAGE